MWPETGVGRPLYQVGSERIPHLPLLDNWIYARSGGVLSAARVIAIPLRLALTGPGQNGHLTSRMH